MKDLYLFISLLFFFNFSSAQIWTGSAGSSWNNAANWNGNNVPTATGNAVIPGGLTNYPLLQDAVVINSIVMQTGSRIDMNGYSITLNGNAAASSFTGALITNSNAAITVSMNLNTGTGNSPSYFNSNTVNANLVFNITGNTNFIEGDTEPGNRYNGNTVFNLAGTLQCYIAKASTSFFAGNLSVTRTVSGNTNLFNGIAVINGNFSYNNSASGNTLLGSSNTTYIAGTVNVNCNYTLPALFEMRKIVNNTGGGNITIQNSTGFNLENNALKIASINISGYKGGQYAYLANNIITGDVSIADNAGFSDGLNTSVLNNTITGNTIFTISGNNSFFDAPSLNTVNRYLGNVSFTGTGNGNIYIAHLDSLYCTGNVSINRTIQGFTEAFYKGSTIKGNFNYNNQAGGETLLGGSRLTAIDGTVDINADCNGSGTFQLTAFRNHTNGGSISIRQSQGFNFQNDTLQLNSLNITGYRNGQQAVLNNSDVKAAINISDDAGFGNGFNTYINGNRFTGNTAFTMNGNSIFYERGIGFTTNIYNGSVSFTRYAGTMYVGNLGFAEITNDLTINADAGVIVGGIKFKGGGNSLIKNSGMQPIEINALAMEKTSGGTLTLNEPVSITGNAELTSGIINATANNKITFANGSSYTGGSNASYINGPVIKSGGTVFTFPVGKSGRIAPIGIAGTGVNTDAFTAEYFMTAASDSGYNASQKDPSLDHISSKEFWQLNRSAGTSATAVLLSWNADRSGVVNNTADLRVAHWDGSRWQNEGQGFINGDNTAGIIYTAEAVNYFSPFTLASASSLNPLPVTLLSFTAAKNNNAVKLQWITANEINLSNYGVERSADGIHYTTINNLPPHGNAAQNTYTTIDNIPLSGINYYRLKITDIDGKYSYSAIATVTIDNPNNTISIWPNPASNYITINNVGTYNQVQVFDVTGKLVKQMKRSADDRYPVYDLVKGLYIIKLITVGETLNARLMIQ